MGWTFLADPIGMAASQKTSPERGEDRRRRSRVRGATTGWIIPDTGQAADPWEVRFRGAASREFRHRRGDLSLRA